MLIYLVDPVHTYTGTQNSAFIPLSVLNISSYIQEQFGSEIDGEGADSNYGKKLRKK